MMSRCSRLEPDCAPRQPHRKWSGGSIVSLLSTGELRLIDWKTGRVQVLGTAKLPEQSRCYVGADLHRCI